MKLIDTHIHVWNLEKVSYPWLEGDTSILRRNYTLEELEPARQAVGVTGGVLVQAANSWEDTEWMLRTAAEHEWISGVVGWLPLEDPDATARLLEEEWATGKSGKAGNLLKGVRHLIHNEADARWLLREPVLESLGLLASRDIPYDVVGIIPEHIATVLEVAERWPDLRMVFDHLNQPRKGAWEGLMKEAAKHENFYVKISGLGGKKEMEPAIEFALHYFGGDRCFCGGDWPVALLAGSYEETWAMYKSIVEKYTKARDNLFWGNAERFYGLLK
ncbi:MAG TPA: amidohydrolase family protein [Puia sp.]|jgi:L-fuconolactonase